METNLIHHISIYKPDRSEFIKKKNITKTYVATLAVCYIFNDKLYPFLYHKIETVFY